MLIVICVKFYHDRTSAALKTNLTKNFNLRMDLANKQTNGRKDRGSKHQIDTIFLNNDMLIAVCVKFQNDMT